MSSLIGGAGGGGGSGASGGLKYFSTSLPAIYEAPANYLNDAKGSGPAPETGALKLFNDFFYSIFAANVDSYRANMGQELKGFEGMTLNPEAQTQNAATTGAAKAPEQQNYSDFIEQWRKKRGGQMTTMLTGLGAGGNEKLGG